MIPKEWKSAFVEDEAADKYILNEEIEYGVNLRKCRNQEKQILRATEDFSVLTSEKDNVPPFSRAKLATKECRKRKRKRKKRKSALVPLLPKMSEKFVWDRNSCSKKEYYDILSKPKAVHVREESKKKNPGLNPASPRFAQLAIPLKNRVFNTWQDYFKLLKPEHILNLKSYLTKEEALAPQDAQDYFKRLDKKKKLQRKIKKKKKKEEEIVTRPQKSKVLKEINKLASLLVKYFAEKQTQTVKCTHVMLTEIMKQYLERENCIPGGAKRNIESDPYSKTLFDVLDQISVWLEGNISFDDVVDSDEEPQAESVSSVSTITYSDISDISLAKKIIKEVSSDLGQEEEGEESVSSSLRFEDRMEQILLDEYIRLGGEGKSDRAEQSEMSTAGALIITFEDGLGHAGSEQEEEEERIGEEVELEEEIISTAEESEGVGEEAYTGAIVTEIIEEEELQGKRLVIEEHSPDAVCCVTIKTWTKWLVDVSHNTHHWCQWIQDVISRVRFFAAVIKGEITTADGKKRILHKEEWDNFTETLDRDIEAWHLYNEHVKTISQKIISEFKDKRIICCSACMKSKLIIDEESAHQVTEQLVQALNTTAYWRGWLDTIVTEAQKLKELIFELPTVTDESSGTTGTGSSSLGYFEIIEIKSPSPDSITTRSSDGSVFVLIEMDKDEEKQPPAPPGQK